MILLIVIRCSLSDKKCINKQYVICGSVDTMRYTISTCHVLHREDETD